MPSMSTAELLISLACTASECKTQTVPRTERGKKPSQKHDSSSKTLRQSTMGNPACGMAATLAHLRFKADPAAGQSVVHERLIVACFFVAPLLHL